MKATAILSKIPKVHLLLNCKAEEEILMYNKNALESLQKGNIFKVDIRLRTTHWMLEVFGIRKDCAS